MTPTEYILLLGRICSLLLIITTKWIEGSTWERKLVYDKLEEPGYNPLIRPVENTEDNITVQFGITLFQVITVEERTQIMKTNNWIRMMWLDYQMKWDPNDYGGIKSFRLPCTKLWKPDVVLLNNADGKYEQSYCCQTVIYSDGNILWIPPSIYKSSCTIDVKYFPFDQQECDMKFGSWTFSGTQVQMAFLDDKDSCDLSNYVFSGTWDIIGCPATIKTTHKLSEINYIIKLRRKTLFFTVNLLTPCVLISLLSVLTFYLPADAQEKVTLCISILLALVVFLLLVSRSLPPTSVTIPLISKYLFFTFIMNIITVIVSVVIININFRSPRTYKMPRWMRVIFLNWLPIIMFMRRPDHNMKYERWKMRKEEAANMNGGGKILEAVSIECGEREAKFHEVNPTRNRNESRQGSLGRASNRDWTMSASPSKISNYSEKAQQALQAVTYISAHLRNRDDYNEVCHDWKYVAAVIDRFLLYIFLSVTIAGTISIIADAPHIFEFIDQKDLIDDIQAGLVT